MKFRSVFLPLVIITISTSIKGQVSQDSTLNDKRFSINGFIRAGFYGDLHDNSPSPFISTCYSDLGLQIDSRIQNNFRAFADVRFRYGSEYHEPVSQVTVREAYVDYTFSRFSITAGQKILKWGRADFTNPTSRLNPQDYISRSPDRGDMDLGNIIAAVNWFPTDIFNLQAVAVPFYKSSVLLIDPIPLPENVTIGQMNTLVTDQKLFSYGLKADFHPGGVDLGASWFEGYDPMPGIALKQFSADFTGPVPVTTTALQVTPYKTRVAGLDFETSAGIVGIRGEAAWSKPVLSYKDSEYVPLQEIKWVAGADIALGNWRFTGEYSGKVLPGFEPSSVDPIIGTAPDYAKLAELLATPGFDLESYVRDQVAAFNRLYNYQLKKWYQQAGLRIEADMGYGRFLPSIYTMYNFTTRDLLVIPEIKIKPVDALTLVVGAEIWSGKEGSLFYIIKDYMTSIYAGLRVDF
ncbi:MAG: hypothetical protein ABR974_02025 [Bacteroidales bacterium]|jgi:hypothetical protein